MTKTFYKVQCTNATHRLCMHDGTFTSSDAECAKTLEERLSKLAGLARLGAPIDDVKGCLGLALLVQHGLPSVFSTGGVGEEMRLGHWRALYIRYESHSLVIKTCTEIRRAAHAQHAELISTARAHLLLLRQAYRVDLQRNELVAMTTFVPDTLTERLNGQVVAHYASGHWMVPLQRDWLTSVHQAGMAVIDNHFVVGVSEETPGIVFAVSNEAGRMVVREFFFNHHTRLLGAIKPESTGATP